MIQKDFVKLRTSLKLSIGEPKTENWEKERTTFQALLSGPRTTKSVSSNGCIVAGYHLMAETYKPLV